MWSWIKRRFRRVHESGASDDWCNSSDIKWIDLGDDNPFPFRIADVRPFTWGVVAMTKSPQVAESFGIQRRSDGREFIETEIADATTVDCHLTFPHNGKDVEGIVYKAKSMEVKWDIYVYGSVFLFVRSWTGRLVYRAFAEIGDTEIRIHRIETSRDRIQAAPQAVYFILGAHAMGRPLPHTVPRNIPNDLEQIAVFSFHEYGHLGCFATYDDITRIEIPRPTPEA